MKRRYGLTLALLLMLSACCAVCKNGPVASLTGTTWVMTELNGQPLQLPTEAEAPSMRFNEGKVQGSDGCNQYQGSYEEKDGRLTFGPLAATRRFCGEPVAAIEQGFYQVLDSHSGYRFRDGSLEMVADEKVLARFSGESREQLQVK